MAAKRKHAPRWNIARFFGKTAPARARKNFGDSLAYLGSRTYMVAPGSPVWMDRDYSRFAQEGYIRNVVAHRCIAMIAQCAAHAKPKFYLIGADGLRTRLLQHPLLDVLNQPNPSQAHASFMEAIYHYRQIAGNAFVQAVAAPGVAPQELHVLRPDRVAIIAGPGGYPSAYRYTVNGVAQDFPVDPITWMSQVLHVKTFHPLNDWYGLSPVEAAAYSIDQHNQAGAWNQALLQNGARPSGALVVKGEGGAAATLSEDQYHRLKTQIDEQFSGPVNAGKPMLLEGGLDWKELSLSPKDMDFLQCKNASARDIALGFGVPPQMLGIPGDNTYSNLQEARLALWEQTVVPLVNSTMHALGQWLIPMFGGDLELHADFEGIDALILSNQAMWDRMQKTTFLTNDEKRAAVGYGPDPMEAVPAADPSAKDRKDDGDDAATDGDGGESSFGDSVGTDSGDDSAGGASGTEERVPAGISTGGEWTSDGTNGGGPAGGTQVAENNTTATDAQTDNSKFDTQGAADKLNQAADQLKADQIANGEPNKFGDAACAHYVVDALNHGGGLDVSAPALPTPAWAKFYGPQLEDAGFAGVVSTDDGTNYPPAGYTPQTGDVAVIQNTSASKYGHMAMYNGSQWVSDFRQAGFWPGAAYRAEMPSFTIYRYPQ